MSDQQPNGWFQKHVLQRLDSIDDKLDSLSSRELQREGRLSKVEVRASFAGFLGGLIPAATALIYVLLKS